MILKGAQRGNAKKLADHLLNEDDNDFVEVHEVSGFLSEDVTGAFKEVQAVAMGSRCTQPFFSVSLSPPPDVSATVEDFEQAIGRIAKAQGLSEQPRSIIFHEKEGRRHAHVVFSRIDAQSMKAIELPFFKNRLMTLSRELFVEHQWKMPAGLRDRSQTSPANVTLAEWQAAKRRGKNAIDQKKLIQQCWAISDSRAGFEAALKDFGYMLARGDRRGHVVVCHDGEILAVARALGLKAKHVRERLGEADGLPTVGEALARHAKDVRGQFVRMAGEARKQLSLQRSSLDRRREQMIAKHRRERSSLDNGQQSRWDRESSGRAARFKTGLDGVWQQLTGKRRAIAEQNGKEAYAALLRDRAQRQALIDAQLRERHGLEQQRVSLRQQAFGLIDAMRVDSDPERTSVYRFPLKLRSQTKELI